MRHFAATDFWDCYHRLPVNIQKLADRCFQQLKQNPSHRSLHFKKVNGLYSARVGLHYRALAAETPSGDLIWIWIGSHAEYDQILGA